MTGGRILLVEDDRALVELIDFHLAKAGYETVKTASGDEALLLVRESPPDLVLLDWMIEGTSGIEVCRQLARIAAVLRRVRPALAGGTLAFEDLEMDLATYRVRRGGRPIHLSPSEFRLLRHFMESPRRVFTREGLLDTVWSEGSELDLRTVDVQIRRIRKALNEGGRPDLIRTVRSAGYALESAGGG